MPISVRDVTKFLGYLGTIAGICGGIAAVLPFLQPKPTVDLYIEKGALFGIPASGGDPKTVQEIPGNLGTVTVTVRNNSQDPISPQLKFHYLQDLRGIVVAESWLDREKARKLEAEWNKKIDSDPNDTTITLPVLNSGSAIKVQAFGTNWKNVDLDFVGVSNPRKTWFITVADSRAHKYLFEYHLWILCLVVFLIGCVLLVKSRVPAPSGP
jgi:hypothetical protein